MAGGVLPLEGSIEQDNLPEKSARLWRRMSSVQYDDLHFQTQEVENDLAPLIKTTLYSLIILLPPCILAAIGVLTDAVLHTGLPDLWHYVLWELVAWLTILTLLLSTHRVYEEQLAGKWFWQRGEPIGTRKLRRAILTPWYGPPIIVRPKSAPPESAKPSPHQHENIVVEQVIPSSSTPPQPAQQPSLPSQPPISEETQTQDALINDPTLDRDKGYLNIIPEMLQDLKVKGMPEQGSTDEGELKGRWTLISDESKSAIPLKQWRLETPGKSDTLSIKIVGVMNGNPEAVFNACMDDRIRPEWDDLLDESTQLDLLNVKGYDRILYVKTKAVFPTAPRDLVLLAHTFSTPHPIYPNITRYVNLTKSVDYSSCPPKSGVVRIQSGVAGIIVEPLLDDQGQPIPGKSRVMQLADTSVGNVPGWLVRRVVATMMPGVFKKLAACVEKRAKQESWDEFLDHMWKTYPDVSRKELLLSRQNGSPGPLLIKQSTEAVQASTQESTSSTPDTLTEQRLERLDPLKLIQAQLATLDTRLRILELSSTQRQQFTQWPTIMSMATTVFVLGWHAGTRKLFSKLLE